MERSQRSRANAWPQLQQSNSGYSAIHFTMRPFLALSIVLAVAVAEPQGRRVVVRGRPRQLGGVIPVAPVVAPTPLASPGCPELGVLAFDSPASCHEGDKCVNGTFLHEVCGNGLIFDQRKGGCTYNWNYEIDCAANPEIKPRPYNPEALGTGVCEYANGLYPVGACLPTYFKCENNIPSELPCDVGLVYDIASHSCNFPDLLIESQGCDPVALLGGFRCPASPNELSPFARRFFPFPRFPVTGQPSLYILCVNQLPRLHACGPNALFNEAKLSCEEQF